MSALIFGEALWDIIDGESHLGGAPLNVAIHLSQLGHRETYLVSAVGQDKLGWESLNLLRQRGVNTAFVQGHPCLPTGTVDARILPDGDATYTIHEGVAWDEINLPAPSHPRPFALPKVELLYYGTLAQRTPHNRALLHTIIAQTRAEHRFFDVNLRQHFHTPEILLSSLETATILKTNAEEATVLSETLTGRALEPVAAVEAIRARFSLDYTLLTLGSGGVILFSKNGTTKLVPQASTIVNTIGAGDSLSAGFIYGLLQKRSPHEAIQLGIRLADYVVSQPGATPELPPQWS